MRPDKNLEVFGSQLFNAFDANKNGKIDFADRHLVDHGHRSTAEASLRLQNVRREPGQQAGLEGDREDNRGHLRLHRAEGTKGQDGAERGVQEHAQEVRQGRERILDRGRVSEWPCRSHSPSYGLFFDSERRKNLK
jgi:hypothetical protein